ncbi:MAG: hypothetical protein A2275_05435 [Bacteroidetes bacterium RIFOXYA12_FULL_35_11]|nr:MAG: hypothetical protein A2X01_10695 [Bacteroidetes bacterium GWF2_35_48]OFY73832.1 MAG: hypothetical protein A2275_05435 [Bacteroidetes bacterium RIFOXYA12_FULL_35_11]OFZ03186.1 MAG: hypothetical protein A2491_18365 [Bacteroidetes bacterium RIFOXYC12_FULL_35_7]HBX49882.1 histidine kinase [Bacteroidales bacterium]
MNKLTDQELLDELKRRFEDNQKSFEEQLNLTEQLKKVNKKLEDSENLKSHFLSNIRNEIINPFASIMALSKSITTLKSENFEKAKIMASLIHSEAFILDFQLNNIFTAAELEAGISSPQISNVNILSVINSLVDSFKPLAEQKKLRTEIVNENLSLDPPFYFKSDAHKIQLIVSNLLSNAIFYSYENTTILLTVSKCEDNICFSITDSGIGINEEHKQEIFDRFKRINSKICTPNTGHGLGLSIVRELLSLLNGNLNVQSEPNVGSTFSAVIPEAQVEDIGGFSSDGNEEIF